MAQHTPHVGAALDDTLAEGQRVMTKEGYPGVVTEVLDGYAIETYIVVLDGGMGGGEYSRSEINPIGSAQAASTQANVPRTAMDDYPELGTILVDRPDHQHAIPAHEYFGGRVASARVAAQSVYYHGTDAVLKPGDVLVPGSQIGKNNWPGMDNDWGVWLTPHPDVASKYGKNVYRVEPVGEVTDWAEENGWDKTRENEEYVASSARVVGLQAEGAAMVHCRTCDVDYPIDGPDEVHDHSTKKADLYLPPTAPAADEQPTGEGIGDGHDSGFADGKHDAMSRGARNPRSNESAYRAGYEMGWALGVENVVPQPQPQATDPDDLGQGLDVGLVSTAGGFMDFLRGSGEPGPGFAGAGHNLSYDWCRFRKNSRCMYPKTLNEAATKEAGYSVWVPEDRGLCPRGKWEDQQACPVAEPGPHVPGGFLDATVPWEQGGQHGGIPSPGFRAPVASISEAVLARTAVVLDPEFRMHVMATFADVRTKAKRIRSEGKVRILSTREGLIAAQVQGEQNVYQTVLTKVPGRKAVAFWECGCAWGAYSWGRTGRWKRFEGRMCSHALATQYEAQSRGMFGREVAEDAKTPAWLDPTRPVKVPGDWDRDKGRYSSLRPVQADLADDVAPVHLMTVDALSSGASIEQATAMLISLGVRNAALVVKQARGGSFMAKVRGLLTRVFVEEGTIADSDGKELDWHEVLYPTYDPHLGLNPSDRKRFSSLRRESILRFLIAAGTDMTAAAKAMITLAQRNEPTVTKMLTGLARKHSAHLEGLDHRFKTVGSLVRKMKAEQHEFGGDAGRTAYNMSDSLRYTMVANPKNYVRTTKATLDALHEAGYKTRVKNYWARNDPYQGINVAAMTPSGHPFELQFHTPESLRVKTKDLHPSYERMRVSTDERERKSLHDRMTAKANRIEIPGGVESIGTERRQDYRPLPGNEWPAPHRKQKAAGAEHPYAYHLLHTVISGTPTTVMREYKGPDDYRTEVWRDGKWVTDNHYMRHVLLGGDARTEPITEAEANEQIRSGAGRARHASLDQDEFEGLLMLACAADEADEAAEPTPTKQGATQMSDDEWGLALPVTASRPPQWEPTAEGLDQFSAAIGSSVRGDEFGLAFDDTIDQDPDAAVPVTYGEDEEQARQAILASITDDAVAMLSEGYQRGEVPESAVRWYAPDAAGQSQAQADLLAAHQARLAAQAEGVAVSGPDPFAHLMSGNQASPDVAQAAKAFLAKSALKDFSPAERTAIIEEGVGVRAGNFDDLDIAGTHYAALPTDDDDDSAATGWMWT